MLEPRKTIDFISRKEERRRGMETRNRDLRRRLQQEMRSHDDVLVVPVLETYRNLAAKLLHFAHWYDC